MIIRIIGGLGNQMFQYAFAYALSKNNKVDLKLDLHGFNNKTLRKYDLGLFKVTYNIATKEDIQKLKTKQVTLFQKFIIRITKIKPKPTPINQYKEPHFHFDLNALDKRCKNYYFDGYWQSEQYFIDHREALLDTFTLSKEISHQSKAYLQDITNSDSISLHIRRGDYVSNEATNKVHGTCNLDYYQQAFSILKEKQDDAHFFIFSDDLNWAKDNLGFIDNITYIELAENIPDHEEMFLMSQCDHNIIANSSFSWWGAWLNQHKNKIVIAPKNWFRVDIHDTKDLTPADWMLI